MNWERKNRLFGLKLHPDKVFDPRNPKIKVKGKEKTDKYELLKKVLILAQII